MKKFAGLRDQSCGNIKDKKVCYLVHVAVAEKGIFLNVMKLLRGYVWRRLFAYDTKNDWNYSDCSNKVEVNLCLNHVLCMCLLLFAIIKLVILMIFYIQSYSLTECIVIVGVRKTGVVCLSVCLSVCLCVCLWTAVWRNYWVDFNKTYPNVFRNGLVVCVWFLAH